MVERYRIVLLVFITISHSPIVKAMESILNYSFWFLLFILNIPLILSLESFPSFLSIYLLSTSNPMSLWPNSNSFPFFFFCLYPDEVPQINCSLLYAIQMKVRGSLDWTQNPDFHICKWHWIESISLSNQIYNKTTIIERFWP